MTTQNTLHPLIEKYKDVALHIIEICQRLHSRNMLSAADGNMSYRISNTEILITPSGIAKAFMKLSDMTIVTLDNQILIFLLQLKTQVSHL